MEEQDDKVDKARAGVLPLNYEYFSILDGAQENNERKIAMGSGLRGRRGDLIDVFTRASFFWEWEEGVERERWESISCRQLYNLAGREILQRKGEEELDNFRRFFYSTFIKNNSFLPNCLQKRLWQKYRGVWKWYVVFNLWLHRKQEKYSDERIKEKYDLKDFSPEDWVVGSYELFHCSTPYSWQFKEWKVERVLSYLEDWVGNFQRLQR